MRPQIPSILVAAALSLSTVVAAHAQTPLEQARTAAAKGSPAAILNLAREAFDAYSFAEAAEAIDRYESKLGRGKELGAEEIELRRRAELGQSMLDRVEKIQVIDSIEVDADTFFNAFTLSGPSGTFVEAAVVEEALPQQWRDEHPDAEVASPVYVTESGERMIWSTEGGDKATSTTMWASDRLADGTWDTPRALFDYNTIFNNESGESVYAPYLMSDGVTLYFGAEGDDSLGGLDIFISRAGDDGTFLQPQNVGMPYNSPADDYLLAIDEINGIGWWATDRAGKQGRVTIYRFIPSDLRYNYPPDTEGLAGLASLRSGVAATHPADADYSELLARVAATGNDNGDSSEGEFVFPLPGGVIYTSMDDFKTDAGRRMMELYLDESDEYSRIIQELDNLRHAYRDGDHSVASRILELEKLNETRRASLQSRANEVIRAELGTAAR